MNGFVPFERQFFLELIDKVSLFTCLTFVLDGSLELGLGLPVGFYFMKSKRNFLE